MSQPPTAGRWRILLQLMADRDLRRLLAIVGSWGMTDVALFLATSVVAYEVGGPAGVGLVGAVRVLPTLVSASAAAVVTDRVHRPHLIAVVHVALVLVAVAMAAAAAREVDLVFLVLIQAVGSLVSGLLKPTMQALLPQLVREPQGLLPANAAWGLIHALGTVVGPTAATGLLFTLGPVGVYLALAAVYAVTAWAAWTIHTPFRPPSRRTAAHKPSWWQDSIRGLSLFMGRGGRSHFALFLVQRLMSGLVTAFVILYAHDVAGADGDAASGTLLAAIGVGGLVGAVSSMVTSGHGRLWFAAGVVCMSLSLTAIGLTRLIPVAAAFLVVSGAGAALSQIHGAALLNRWLPDHVAGRAWGALIGVGSAAAAAGSLAAPVLADVLGLAEAMVPVGLAAAVVPLLCAPGLRFLDTSTTPHPDALAVIKRTEVLAALPDLCLERLAAAAEARSLSAGDVVVSEGDVGDEFFMVESGELQVTQGGHEVRRLGPGDSFGEIALLHAIPRTATVVAVSASSLYSLDHDIFVATVTGHAPTQDWADGAVAGLLAEDERRTGAR
jgi:MFS family permease